MKSRIVVGLFFALFIGLTALATVGCDLDLGGSTNNINTGEQNNSDSGNGQPGDRCTRDGDCESRDCNDEEQVCR